MGRFLHRLAQLRRRSQASDLFSSSVQGETPIQVRCGIGFSKVETPVLGGPGGHPLVVELKVEPTELGPLEVLFPDAEFCARLEA